MQFRLVLQELTHRVDHDHVAVSMVFSGEAEPLPIGTGAQRVNQLQRWLKG